MLYGSRGSASTEIKRDNKNFDWKLKQIGIKNKKLLKCFLKSVIFTHNEINEEF